MKESLHVFDTQNNEFMNNEIKYMEPKNKTAEHIMSLNSSIPSVVGVYILGFEKYWKTVFDLMDINTIPKYKNIAG